MGACKGRAREERKQRVSLAFDGLRSSCLRFDSGMHRFSLVGNSARRHDGVPVLHARVPFGAPGSGSVFLTNLAPRARRGRRRGRGDLTEPVAPPFCG